MGFQSGLLRAKVDPDLWVWCEGVKAVAEVQVGLKMWKDGHLKFT